MRVLLLAISTIGLSNRYFLLGIKFCIWQEQTLFLAGHWLKSLFAQGPGF
jgi:hypothetical protein